MYNHFGPDDLDLWQFDGWHEDDRGGIYFYNDWRSINNQDKVIAYHRWAHGGPKDSVDE
ncbi:MAG TPA: hypothetical protein VFZ76_19325 [Anaerolineales bacterium]